ncbi:MAG: hypothetical protein K2N24_00550 [Lachnospiraceae bacterium]|nr:hypothetical protein [Lachnospiraceae bacterium]
MQKLLTGMGFVNSYEVRIGERYRAGNKKSGVPREEIFLVTKLWPTVYGKETAVDETLHRLGTDYPPLACAERKYSHSRFKES